MKLDERIEKSVNSIEEVNYSVDLTKKEMIKRPKKKYIVALVVILLIALIVPQVIKTVDFFNNASGSNEPLMLLTIEDLVNNKNCYRLKWENDDIKSIKVYYYKKDIEFDENNIFDIISNIKIKNYSNISDINIDETKYEIAFIKLEIDAHLIYDIVKDEEINESIKLTPILYSLNGLNNYILNNTDTIITYDSYDKLEEVGSIVNGKCKIDRTFFIDIYTIHEALSLNDNYYEVDVDRLNEVYSFYDYYLTHKVNVEFNFNYIQLTPKKENSEYTHLVKSIDELTKLSYNTKELEKYDEDFFKDNMLIIYEKNLEHKYGALHGDSEITEIYYQRDNLYIVVQTYKSYKEVYSYSRLVIAEVKKSDMSDYQELIVLKNYGKLKGDITEVTPNNCVISLTPKDVTQTNLEGKILSNSILITGEVTNKIEVVLFKRNENVIEIYYKFNEEGSYMISASYEVPSEFIDGVNTFEFILLE